MQVSTHLLRADGAIPNNERLPLIVYQAAVPVEGSDPARAFEQLFETNGWTGCWRNGIFPFHHFHSTAHEVLGVYEGTCAVQFGGPSGVEIEAAPGDVIVVPAGVAHKRLRVRGRLGVVGAYPRGQAPDLCEADTGSAAVRLQNVEAVGVPELDPVCGNGGPVGSHWGAPAGQNHA